MSIDFEFKCKLNENIFSSITEPLDHEFLYEYGSFSIIFSINNLSITFSSEIANINAFEIENFLNKFRNSESCCISFNDNNGSIINYKNNNIMFNVYTYKEGTLTDLDVNVSLDETIKSKLINIFLELLSLKNRYDRIPIIDEENYQSSIENMSSEDENTQ